MPPPEPVPRGTGDQPAGPLDAISADHLRERQICTVIDGLALADTLHPPAARQVLRFLNAELNLHLRDAAEDLFPLLARRCTHEEAIEATIDRIRADQDQAMRLLPEVRATLAACLDSGAGLTAGGRALLTRFAAHLRRRLVAEHAILLPMARARLTRADLRTLTKHMRSRRGLPDLAESADAE